LHVVAFPSFVERVRRIQRAEYDRMVDLGLFDNEKVELLKGFIVRMSPQKSRHAGAVQYLTQFFVPALVSSGRASVRVRLPFVVDPDSEPEPDVALVPFAGYRDRHPDRAFLIVEVAETSLAADRDKAAVYAAGDVPEYWIVDTTHEIVEVHRDVADGAYTQVTTHRRGESIACLAFPDVPLAVNELLG
jgi:Uma2 family endonuclease